MKDTLSFIYLKNNSGKELFIPTTKNSSSVAHGSISYTGESIIYEVGS